MIGIEREMLRVTPDGRLAETPHQQLLGSPLTHPAIKTDFAEAQLECITPPCDSFEEASTCLDRLHTYIAHNIGDELLWPLSMPCILPDDIAIASYGLSDIAKEKRLYRIGLAHRYPIEMQLISGIHLNLSFDRPFWETLREEKKSPLSLPDFISQTSFDAIRHFLSKGWILTYFFGATPTSPYSTSTRMSSQGYYSKVQAQLSISYDSLDAYMADMKRATQTPHPDYASIGANQISDAHLQIPAEHYGRIRPKGDLSKGVDYIEIRSLDINPFSPLGITAEQAAFARAFLIACLKAEAAPIDPAHCENQNRVALRGRDPTLTLICSGRERPLAECLREVLDTVEMLPPEAPLSARLYEEMNGDPIAFGLSLAKQYKEAWLSSPEPSGYAEQARHSRAEQERLDYEGLELSTQLVRKEAQRRGLKAEVLDRNDNIIRLKQGPQIEYVKQATKTRLDSYISAELMGNKEVTKQLLHEAGIAVPRGKRYTDREQAYTHPATGPLVIKPTHANYGVGITIIEQADQLRRAVDEAFDHGSSVVIEDFVEGDEHRLLVIGGKAIAALRRIPAHVVGDGDSTIDQLVAEKNRRKPSSYPIRVPPSQKVPKNGERVVFHKMSNVSLGGDPVAVAIDPHFAEVAERATAVIGAHICGVDMIMSGDTYAIIELNYNPAIWMHAYPYEGEAIDVSGAILDALFSSPSAS